MQYTVCQIGSRQYLIEPGKTFEVDLMDVEKTLTLELEVVGNIKKDKIRVAKFHAKANYRKVIGSRRQMTVLRLVDTKAKTEKKEVLAPETEESSEKETSKTVVKKGAKKA
jgi:ribosomal protein L21